MIQRTAMRGLLWLAIAALLFAGTESAPPSAAGGARSRASWLDPAAHLAASVQWIRFDLALREGEPERAYVVAEKALALAPGPATGWSTLARHLVFDRASLESEPDPAARRRWIEAGLAVLQRGAERSREPGAVAYLEGLILTAYVAEIAPELRWPGGRRAALERGAKALARASRAGSEDADVLLAAAREALAALGEG